MNVQFKEQMCQHQTTKEELEEEKDRKIQKITDEKKINQ
jgi:hypothetical protein